MLVGFLSIMSLPAFKKQLLRMIYQWIYVTSNMWKIIPKLGQLRTSSSDQQCSYETNIPILLELTHPRTKCQIIELVLSPSYLHQPYIPPKSKDLHVFVSFFGDRMLLRVLCYYCSIIHIYIYLQELLQPCKLPSFTHSKLLSEAIYCVYTNLFALIMPKHEHFHSCHFKCRFSNSVL